MSSHPFPFFFKLSDVPFSSSLSTDGWSYFLLTIRAKFDKLLRAHASTFSPFPPVAMDELSVAWNNEKEVGAGPRKTRAQLSALLNGLG